MLADLKNETLEKIIDVVVTQRKSQFTDQNHATARKVLLNGYARDGITQKDIDTIKIYKFLSHIIDDLTFPSALTTGRFKELTASYLSEDKLQISLNFNEKEKEYGQLHDEFKNKNLKLIRDTFLNFKGPNEEHEALILRAKKDYLKKAFNFFSEFMDDMSAKGSKEKMGELSLDYFLEISDEKENSKYNLISNIKSKVKDIKLKISEVLKSERGIDSRVEQENNSYVAKKLSRGKLNLIIDEYNSTKISNRNKVIGNYLIGQKEGYFDSEEDFYSHLNQKREKGTKLNYSHKLFEDKNQSNLRSELTKIYAYSKNAQEAILAIKSQLNINISKTSLYSEVKKYRKDNDIGGKNITLNGAEKEITDKTILNKHFEHKRYNPGKYFTGLNSSMLLFL
ncbi:MAG: hypothetical protein ACP5N2_04285 [Candidatus Nanoarchaeia archaeon]